MRRPVILCVHPLDKFRKPDMSYIEGACLAIRQHLKPGTFICLESTTTTKEFMHPIIEKESKLSMKHRIRLSIRRIFD